MKTPKTFIAKYAQGILLLYNCFAEGVAPYGEVPRFADAVAARAGNECFVTEDHEEVDENEK